jgi:GntR family transcriptional repressor for pyruvate dehydrogenase complex
MSRLHRSMLRVLLADIVAGRFEPGARLPSEADLADSFGVSRGVARECIRGLEERGLVMVTHGRGATVRADAQWDMYSPEVLSAVLESERAGEVLGEYLECRRVLEIEAAALAAERAGEDDLVALTDAFERMVASALHAAAGTAGEDLYHEADVAFHRAVIGATGNRPLGRMTEPLHRALETARRPLARPDARVARSLPEHRRILVAISAGDPDEARAATRAHLLTVEEYLRDYLAAAVSC